MKLNWKDESIAIRRQKYLNEMKALKSCKSFSQIVAVLSDFGEAVSAI